MIFFRSMVLFSLFIAVHFGTENHAQAQDWQQVKLKNNPVSYGRVSSAGDAVTVEGKFTDTNRTYQVLEERDKFVRISDGTRSGWVFKISVAQVAEEPVPKELAQGSTIDPLVGKRVVVIRDESPLQVSGSEVAKASECSVFTVARVQGNWLWIAAEKAYLRRSDVVLFDDAIDYYTRQLDAKKTAGNYWQRAQIWRLKGELDIALGDMNEAIRLDSTKSAWFNGRGILWADKKEYDKAIADYSEAIRLDPKNNIAYNNRGIVWHNKSEYNKAIADFVEALRHTEPTEQVVTYSESETSGGDSNTLINSQASIYNGRGLAWYKKREYERAIADYEEAIRLDPRYNLPRENRLLLRLEQGAWDKVIADCQSTLSAGEATAFTYNCFAWVLATCPDERYCNGTKAVEYATSACEISDWKDPNDLGTLAAAYAEAGDFAKAIEYQTRAIELAATAEKDEYVSTLSLYQDNKPYRLASPLKEKEENEGSSGK